ncbi:MAG: hypothetical protein QME96_15540, partial [Myxococcota bacterium]|nr:hypothetical protein [Myxococcota bacterium]
EAGTGRLDREALLRVLRVALTAADLDGVDDADERHMAEAIELADPDGLVRFLPLPGRHGEVEGGGG